MFPQNDIELKPDKNIAIRSQDCKRILLIHKCTYEDQGEYLCRTADDNTAATLTVHGTIFFAFLSTTSWMGWGAGRGTETSFSQKMDIFFFPALENNSATTQCQKPSGEAV